MAKSQHVTFPLVSVIISFSQSAQQAFQYVETKCTYFFLFISRNNRFDKILL